MISCKEDESESYPFNHFELVYNDGSAPSYTDVPKLENTRYIDDMFYSHLMAIKIEFGDTKPFYETVGNWRCYIYLAYDDYKGAGKYYLGSELQKGKAWISFYKYIEKVSDNTHLLELFTNSNSIVLPDYIEIYAVSNTSLYLRFNKITLYSPMSKSFIEMSGNFVIKK